MKKNIAIIIQKLSGGGAERVAANMSIDLEGSYNISLIVFDMSDATYKHEGKLFNLNLPSKNGFFGKLINVFLRIKAVRKIKREQNIECSISLMEGANIVNVLSKVHDKVIISERNLVSFFAKGQLAHMLVKYISNGSDLIVALSEVVKKDLINNFNIPSDKIVTIYNSVDIKKFDFKCYNQDDNQIQTIVTMGRLTNQKAQWHLFRAFKYINQIKPNTRLIIIGQGELYEDYCEFVTKLEISDNVKFVGFLKNPHDIIKKSEIFAFSSMVEGLGNVILEALACGKAIVSTDCDAGPREILAPDTDPTIKTEEIEFAKYGVLVPTTKNDSFDKNNMNISKNEKKLGDAILYLLNNNKTRKEYEKQALLRINDFSPEVINNLWRGVIG